MHRPMENDVDPPELNPYASPEALDPAEDELDLPPDQGILAAIIIGAFTCPALLWLVGDLRNLGWLPEEITWSLVIRIRIDQMVTGSLAALGVLSLWPSLGRRQFLPKAPGHWMAVAWLTHVPFWVAHGAIAYDWATETAIDAAQMCVRCVYWIGIVGMVPESKTWRLYAISSAVWASAFAAKLIAEFNLSEVDSEFFQILWSYGTFMNGISAAAVLFFAMLGVAMDFTHELRRDRLHTTAIVLCVSKLATAFIARYAHNAA